MALQRRPYPHSVLSGMGYDLSLIERQHMAIPHDDASADDHRPNILGLQRVDDLGIEIVERDGVRRIQAENNEVGLLSSTSRCVSARWIRIGA